MSARGKSTKGRSRGRSAAPRGRAKARQPGMLEAMGFAPETVRRMAWLLLIAILAMMAIAALFAFQVPRLAGIGIGEAIGRAGFSVQRVEIKGNKHMARLPVYAVALDQPTMAMPLVDLEATRQRLLKFGWIEDARVSRRLPDTLVVDIVERKPAAVWQNGGRLALIDKSGIVLGPVKLDQMPDLPVVIGAGANRHATELDGLLASADTLKPMLAGATWVGGRRWDLRFRSGEILSLPEGNDAAKKALVHFVRMDKSAQLLGRGFARFDMRIPGKIAVRITNQPGSIVPDLPEPGPPSVPIDPNKAT